MQREILHFVQNDKLPYVIVNMVLMVIFVIKTVSLSYLIEFISEISWTNPTSHPEAHWAVYGSPQNGPIFVSLRLQLRYNRKPRYLPIQQKCPLHKSCIIIGL